MSFSFGLYNKVLHLFKEKEVIWATEISREIWISRVVVHKILIQLVWEKKIQKIGEWPQTRYKSLIFSGKVVEISDDDFALDFKDKKFLDQSFYKFDSDGVLLIWYQGFKKWLSDRNFEFESSFQNYKKIAWYIERLEDNCWLIDSTEIFSKKFEKNHINKVFYAWEYSFMEFGRSRLAEMTFYAKQSQNRDLINQSIEEIFYKLECLIRREKIDAIAITPWSIKRTNQLLKILEVKLQKMNLPFVDIIKNYDSNIPIPQKTIKSKEWRIKNAENTIFVTDKNTTNYSNILLIDDFVWSGATLNITARKLKEAWATNVIWFSFVGSLDLSYEVINEI